MQNDLISKELSVHNISRHKTHMLATGNIDIPKYMSVGVHEISFVRGFEYGMELAEKLVSNQPIAYNVEKVEKQIHDFKCQKCRNILGIFGADKYCEGVHCEVYRICEMVRNGGK